MHLNWLLKERSKVLNESKYKVKFQNSNHELLFEDNPDDNNYYWDNELKEGVFIIGYLLPKLNFSKKINPKYILNYFKESGKNSLLNYKGIYTIIFFLKKEVFIFTDRLGVSKFFTQRVMVNLPQVID